MEWIPVKYIGDPQGFCNFIPTETLPTWTERNRKRMKWKKAITLPKFSKQETLLKLLSWKRMKKEGLLWRHSHSTQDSSQALEPLVCLWLDFRIAWVWLLVFSFQCFPFRLGMPVTGILWQPYNCILGAENLFSSFTGSKMEKSLPQDGWYPESHIYLILVIEMMRFRWAFWTLSWCCI